MSFASLLEPLVITKNDIRSGSFLASSRPSHTLVRNVLPPLISKQQIRGVFLDYPSHGEAEEAAGLLEKLGMTVSVGPAFGRVLKDQIWWKRFVVVAGTDTFDLAALQSKSFISIRNFDTSWCTNDKNVRTFC